MIGRYSALQPYVARKSDFKVSEEALQRLYICHNKTNHYGELCVSSSRCS